MARVAKDSVRQAYDDVRDDNSETMWATFKYEGRDIIHESSGIEFEEFHSKFGPEDRGFGFLRVTTGDELSKRSKFVLITWCGPDVSPLKRAKLSADKGTLKQVIQNFALEMLLTEDSELNYESISAEVRKAGGANYGTGSRD